MRAGSTLKTLKVKAGDGPSLYLELGFRECRRREHSKEKHQGKPVEVSRVGEENVLADTPQNPVETESLVPMEHSDVHYFISMERLPFELFWYQTLSVSVSLLSR